MKKKICKDTYAEDLPLENSVRLEHIIRDDDGSDLQMKNFIVINKKSIPFLLKELKRRAFKDGDKRKTKTAWDTISVGVAGTDLEPTIHFEVDHKNKNNSISQYYFRFPYDDARKVANYLDDLIWEGKYPSNKKK